MTPDHAHQRCEEMLQALNDYIDNETLTALCREFASHLEGCHPCQIVVDNIRQTIRLYKDGEPYPVPAQFSERLRGAMIEQWKKRFPEAKIETESAERK